MNDTMLMLVMLFSASALPLIDVPDWWANASHAFPLTDSVGSLYHAVLTDTSVTSMWGLGGLVPMAVTSVGYLLAGVLAFGAAERIAKRRGVLGSY